MVHLPRLELLDGRKKGLQGHLVALSNGRPDLGTARGVGVLPKLESRVTRVSVWRLAAMPFAAGVAIRVLVVIFVQVLHGNFLFLDDQGYDQIGWSLAQAWHMKTFPSPESVEYAGALDYLYYVFVAAVYFVFGHHWMLVKLAAALLSALSVPAAASIGVSLGGRRLGIRAAWLAALYPSAVFWGTTGLKDGPLATLLLAVAAIALRPPTMRRMISAVALIVVAFLSRPIVAVSGVAMLLVSAMAWSCQRGQEHRVRTKSRLVALLVGVPGLAAASVLMAAGYLPVLKASMAGEADLSLATGPVAVNYGVSPSEVLRSLLGPFPWSFGPNTDSVYRALYPGMVVWIVMLPSIALGCWELLRRGSWAARGVIASALAFLYLYVTVFQSQGFFRQRYTVEILLLVAGLYAFQRFPRRAAVWTAVGACVVASGSLVQARVVPLTDLALAVIVLGSLWYATHRVTRARARRSRRSRVRPRHALALAGTPAYGGDSGSKPELDLTLARATSTGVRVMVLRVSGYAVGFIASILIARALGPTGRGLYAYPIALLGLVMALAHLGLESAQVHLAAKGKDLRYMWADATLFSVVATTACWVVVAGVVTIDPRATGGLPLSWIAVPMGLVPLLLMNLYWASLLQLDGRLMMATWASWFGVALQMVAIGVLFFTHELTPFRVLLLQWLTNGSAWFLLLLACRRAGLVNLRVDRALFHRSLAFGVKAYVAQIFFYLVLRADQVLVAHYAGYRQLGLYALATTVAELLWLLTDPLASALLPHMVRAQTGDDRRLSFSTARLSLCILIIAAVGAWFLAPLVIPVVYGAGFAGAVPALRLLLPGVVGTGRREIAGVGASQGGANADHERAGPQRARPEHSPQHRAPAADRDSRRKHCVLGLLCGAGALVRSHLPTPRGGGVAGSASAGFRSAPSRPGAPRQSSQTERRPAASDLRGRELEPLRHGGAGPCAGLSARLARPPGDGDLSQDCGRPGRRCPRCGDPCHRGRLSRPAALDAAKPVSRYPPSPPNARSPSRDIARCRPLLPVLGVPDRRADRAKCPRARCGQLAEEPHRRL